MLWHEKSWPEIDAIDRETPVVIPVAACEQHGRHLPVFVDTIQVTTIAEKVESALQDRILLTPTMWLGSSHHHKDFPGTISVVPSLFSEIVKSLADSVLRAGFRRIVFLNGHGGNIVPGSQALSELVATRDDADNAYLVFTSWWFVGKDALKPEDHGMETPAITHACEYETSMLLFLRPDLVHMDRVREMKPVLDSPWYHPEHEDKVGVYRRFHRLTGPGNMGKPSAGTGDKGKSMHGAVVADIVAFLEEFATWPELPVVTK